MVHYIYKITCLCGSLAGHYYIGKRSACQNEKYYGSGKRIKEYYKQYPPIEGETIIKEILEYNTSKEDNDRREHEIIGDLYETDPLCLNLKAGGNNQGCKHDDEWKRKISVSHIGIGKGRKLSEETKRKMLGRTPWNKGLKYSEDMCKIISESHKGVQAREKHPMYGKRHSEESRLKMSNKLKGRVSPQKGKHISEETKQKIREDHIGKYTGKDNPNHKAVIAVVVKTGEVEHYNSMADAAKHLNISGVSGISQALHGKLKTAYKRKWTFA